MTILKDYKQKQQEMAKKKSELLEANQTARDEIDSLQKEYEQHIVDSDFAKAEKTKQRIKQLEASIETREDILNVIDNQQNTAIVEEAKKVVNNFKREKERLQHNLDKQLQAADKKREEYKRELEKVAGLNQQYFELTGELAVVKNLLNWESIEVKQQMGIDLPHTIIGPNRKLFNFYLLANELKKEIETIR